MLTLTKNFVIRLEHNIIGSIYIHDEVRYIKYLKVVKSVGPNAVPCGTPTCHCTLIILNAQVVLYYHLYNFVLNPELFV